MKKNLIVFLIIAFIAPFATFAQSKICLVKGDWATYTLAEKKDSFAAIFTAVQALKDNDTLFLAVDSVGISNEKTTPQKDFYVHLEEIKERGLLKFSDLYASYLKNKHVPFNQQQLVGACLYQGPYVTSNECSTLFFVKQGREVYAVTVQKAGPALSACVHSLKQKCYIFNGGDCSSELAYPTVIE